jgi:hypothetical protein
MDVVDQLVEILRKSLPGAPAPPAAQNLLRGKTVDELVKILRNLTPKQLESVTKSGGPEVGAAATLAGSNAARNRVPSDLAQILKQILNSKTSENVQRQATQKLLKNKTVEELVQVMKKQTNKQKTFLSQGNPAAQAAAATTGVMPPSAATPEDLVRVLKEVLDSRLPKRTIASTAQGLACRISGLVGSAGEKTKEIFTKVSELVRESGLSGSTQGKILRVPRWSRLASRLNASNGPPGPRLGAFSRPAAKGASGNTGPPGPRVSGFSRPAPKGGASSGPPGARVSGFSRLRTFFKRGASRESSGGENSPPTSRMANSTGQPVPGIPAQVAPPPPAPARNYTTFSINRLVNEKKTAPTNNVSKINDLINRKLASEVRNLSYNPIPEKIKKYINYLKVSPKGEWRYDLIDIIRQKVNEIDRNSQTPQRARDKLRDLRTTLGIASLRNLGLSGVKSEIMSIFRQAETNLNRRINQEKRVKMNENRNRRGLPPLNVPRNNAPIFRPPPNQPAMNIPPPPPINLGEQKAINNVGGPNRALNLVTNAGGPNNVLKTASQIQEANGDPLEAIRRGANAKNVKIVLQLGGANNAAKVAMATPKLTRRRRSKRKAAKTKAKGRPKVSAIKKLLRSLPKKKLLAVLPKSNKAALANKNKANVATRVTSYLTGRTKKK